MILYRIIITLIKPSHKPTDMAVDIYGQSFMKSSHNNIDGQNRVFRPPSFDKCTPHDAAKAENYIKMPDKRLSAHSPQKNMK